MKMKCNISLNQSTKTRLEVYKGDKTFDEILNNLMNLMDKMDKMDLKTENKEPKDTDIYSDYFKPPININK